MMMADEMVREIMQLQTAIGEGPNASTLHMHFGSALATVRLGDRAVDAPTLAEGLDGLRGKLRAAAEKALAEHEAKAETLRKALGIPSPTYEARTTPPTLAERKVHQEAGGAWLVCRLDSDGKLHSDVLIGWHGWRWEGCIFMALDAERRLCAWPVGGEL